MSPLATPGLQFFADRLNRDPDQGPLTNELYVICQDGTIQSVYQPDRPIDWVLIEEPDGFYYRTTGPPKRCTVRYHSRGKNTRKCGPDATFFVPHEKKMMTPRQEILWALLEQDE